MKDEEMAEEIANKRCHEIGCFGHCNFSSPKHHRCGEWHREYNCALEGIKAGRPQWHDLRKDKNDLPKDANYVLVSDGKDWTKGFYKDKKWNVISLVGFIKIIMWKEIILPKESK